MFWYSTATLDRRYRSLQLLQSGKQGGGTRSLLLLRSGARCRRYNSQQAKFVEGRPRKSEVRSYLGDVLFSRGIVLKHMVVLSEIWLE